MAAPPPSLPQNQWGTIPPTNTSLKLKLRELLRNLQSPELKLYSEASKEFVALLKDDSGGDVLREYVTSSPNLSEILDSWKLHHGKPGIAHVLSLASAILDHPDGKSRSLGISRGLDSFARLILQEKLDDIYGELNSQEHRRQNAALLLLASIVKRGTGLASEVAKVFNFKLPALVKLSGLNRKKKKAGGKEWRSWTRRSFVRFAMSFIEVGNPKLLRWILQQREVYSGVLRGLVEDSFETVVYVLSTLKEKVLTEDSLVPPGLRSVLFGSITLEQLSSISGNSMAGPAADLAHEVLIMACTDPCNGLMPGLNFRGNEKRLFDLMRTLKATEVRNHKELLLAIARRRPSLCAMYMDEFPYKLDPQPSYIWFSAICLAADIISSVNVDSAIVSIANSTADLLLTENADLQCILKCILPRAFSRSVANKGFQHDNILVRHGSLRILFESLKSLSNLIRAIDNTIESLSGERVLTYGEGVPDVVGLPGFSCFGEIDKCLDAAEISSSATVEPGTQKWVALRQYIEDEVRAVLPDPQVLRQLLPSSKNSKLSVVGLKRRANYPLVDSKKLKSIPKSENVDIVIGGLDAKQSDDTPQDWDKAGDEIEKEELDVEKENRMIIAEIWGLNEESKISDEPNSEEMILQSKLFDVFTFYLRTVPIAFEGSIDLFKLLRPLDPFSLSMDQRSLLSLLVEYIGQTPGGRTSAKAPDLYTHLKPIVNILLYSQVEGIRDQAFVLARAAMISTGAFDQNLCEIDAWLICLPGYYMKSYSADNREAESIHQLSAVVISFLCEAVSTVGNHLHKYLDDMRKLINKLDNLSESSPGFSPLVICVLQKCLRLLEPAGSGSFKLQERSMISLYVCNTLHYILQIQVDTRTLSGIFHLVLAGKFMDFSAVHVSSRSSLCEWRPLSTLLSYVWSDFDQQSCKLLISENGDKALDRPLLSVLVKMQEFLEREGGDRLVAVSIAFLSSIVCAAPDDILGNFTLLLNIAKKHFRPYFSFLSWVLFLEQDFLANVADLWPDAFFSGLQLIEGIISKYCENKVHFVSSNGVLQSIRTSISSDLYSIEPVSSAAAFGLFLYHAPFHALFSATMNISNAKSQTSRLLDILHSHAMLNLLQFKLSEDSLDASMLSLRNVFFWTNQTVLSYQTSPSDVLKELLQVCVTLVGYILDHLLTVIAETIGSKNSGATSLTQHVQDIIDFIFHHPIVNMSLSYPMCFSRKHGNETLGDNLQDFLTSSKQNFHLVDCMILQLLEKLFDFIVSLVKIPGCSSRVLVSLPGLGLDAPKKLIQNFVLSFKEKFESSIENKDVKLLLPSFYIFQALVQFVSPFDLLELVHWMFCKLEDAISTCTPAFVKYVSIGLFIADDALSMTFNYIRRPSLNSEINWSWDRAVSTFDATILPKLYLKILEFGRSFNLECADLCLLKVVNAVYSCRLTKPNHSLLPLYTLFSRMVITSPMEMIAHCFYPTTKIKAKILSLLIEVSPMHMKLFGQIFLGIINRDSSVLDLLNKTGQSHPKCKGTSENCTYDLSEDDFVVLLPAALAYLVSMVDKYGNKELKHLSSIPKLYSSILLNGFSIWKSYVSRDIFQDEYKEVTLTSLQDFYTFCSDSLIGKAVIMLHYFFSQSGNSMKKKQRLKLFASIYPLPSLFDDLLISDLQELGSSYKEFYRVINVVVAKIYFTRLLLVPLESSDQFSIVQLGGKSEGKSLERESNRLNCAKLQFLSILVRTLDQIVKMCPLKVDNLVPSNAFPYQVFRYLEYFILRNIVQLCVDTQSYLAQLPSIPFLNQFIRSSLLNRFEDSLTLKALRHILVALSEAEFSPCEVLALLVGHSQFIPTILGINAISDPYTFNPSGALLQTVPTILRSLDFSYTDQTIPEARSICCDISPKLLYNCSSEDVKLELVKLLRILYHLKDRQQNTGVVNVDNMNPRELLSLLLSGYSATLSEIDLEIFHLMHELESIEGSDFGGIAEWDYMWGASALKLRKELNVDGMVSSNTTVDCETVEERRKIVFRENIPIESKLSIMTILHFCNDRSSRTAPLSLKRLLQDNFTDNFEKLSSNIVAVQRYDPAYILRFSIHTLQMGYLEPIEFSRLGLLAITLISISSPDEELRKLGYDSLGKFRSSLENYGSRKDVLQLQLLLTYIQNGITEEWQKIPSIIAMFAAEASFVLLNPSQNQFFTLSKYLMRSNRMNVKKIPLFPKLFRSGSIHFRTERLWILRLLYAGLNSNVDAKIYMRNDCLDLLLSFYASSLSDSDSKNLILQVLKKCVKIPTIAHRLIKEYGLISWLSSIIILYGQRLDGDYQHFSLEIVELVMKIINEGISSRMISDWLQEYALEQLSELSSHLHALAMRSLKSFRGNLPLVESLLTVMVSTLKISQKRKSYQPHFTISIEGLFRLYQMIIVEFSNTGATHIIELGLNVILMSAPVPVISQMDRARLSKLLTLAIPAAQQSFPTKNPLASNCDPDLLILRKEQQGEESLVSKLLRWVTASVILGCTLKKSSEIYNFLSIGRSKMTTLQPIIEVIIRDQCKNWDTESKFNEVILVIILYLQQFLGQDCNFLPSVISAICLLLSNSSNAAGSKFLNENAGAISSLCLKIHCPPEVNPAWRWSYYQPWRDLSSVQTELELMEEEQACQSLLIMFSNALGGKSLGLPFLSHEDVENHGLYEWEKETILGSRT